MPLVDIWEKSQLNSPTRKLDFHTKIRPLRYSSPQSRLHENPFQQTTNNPTPGRRKKEKRKIPEIRRKAQKERNKKNRKKNEKTRQAEAELFLYKSYRLLVSVAAACKINLSKI